MKESEINHPEWYQSQKGFFAGALKEQMKTNPDIWLVTGDLGYGMFDKLKDEFPDRYINVGAAEQTMVGVAIGLALEGKKPFVYTIPNFLIYRPYEWIRNYINHEKIPVKLIGGGRDMEYSEDGYTHQSPDLREVMKLFPNIRQLWPSDKNDVPRMVQMMLDDPNPYFMSLQRKA